MNRYTIGLVHVLVAIYILFTPASGQTRPFYFGVNADNWHGELKNPVFAQCINELGVQFIVWHVSPEELATGRIMECIEFCRANNLPYLFNTELCNYVPGVPEFTNADGTYRWDLTPEQLRHVHGDPLFLGQVYDEPMLMQSLNGAVVQGRPIAPYFVDTSAMLPAQAFDAVTDKISALTAMHTQQGHRTVFEMVLPDYAHAAARGGAVLAPKLLKETPNDLMFALYAGAAREYAHTELWACVDLWFLDKFPEKGELGPGFHTPQNFYDSLCYAYAQGFDYVYVEHLKGLVDLDTGQLTDFGRQVVAFQAVKKDLPRTAWQDFQPQIVVKRFPGGYWGQKYSAFIPDHPYGSAENLPTVRQEDERWLALLSTLSQNKLPPEANTWNALAHPYFQQTPYFPLAGLPSMLVMDHFFTDTTAFPQARFIDLTAAAP
ncbi:MAG: hypothetical protein GX055_04910 [Desulfovibrionales bacterium]|nr:hypothetical protein [Desulfovibrionales bacterium]